METQETKTVEYRVRATLKKTGKELDEKNLLRLLECKLKNAEIFHLPSGVAEVIKVKRLR